MVEQARSLGPFYETEIARALQKMEQPWLDLAQAAKKHQIREADEWRRAIDAATASSSGLMQYYKTHTNEVLRQADALRSAGQPELLRQWDLLTKSLEQPAWKKIFEDLASANLTAEELIERAGELAEEGDLVPVFDDSEEKRDFLAKMGLYMAILGLLMGLWQIIRTEMLAIDSDKQMSAIGDKVGSLDERAKRIEELHLQYKENFEAQALVLTEIQRSIKREEKRRWRFEGAVGVLRLTPEAGSKRIGNLGAGEVGVELEHRGKWLMIEVHQQGRVIAGWTLKKHLSRLRPETSEDEGAGTDID